MSVTEMLEREFCKDKLSKVDMHLLMKTYLEEENDNRTQSLNSFLRRKSKFLNFFRKENFKNKPNKLYKESIIEDNGFTLEIKNKSEMISFCRAKESSCNHFSISYEKIIDGISIRKLFLFESSDKNEESEIDCFFVKISVTKMLINNDGYCGKIIEPYLDYEFYFNKESEKIDLLVLENQIFKEISINTQKNNYVEESFFDIAELICDFDNEAKKILLEFFNAENFDNIDYFKETHDLLDFIKKKIEE